MKLTILSFASLFLFAFGTQTEKTYSFKFSEASLTYHWGNMNAIRQIADESNLPNQQVKFIIRSIDSLQKEMNVQIVEQTKK